MVIRALTLVGCLIVSAALSNLTAATKLFLTRQAPGQIVISVDPSFHQEFGLAYPVTYKLAIPPGSSNLVASTKHEEFSAWTPLPEKTASDFFNGEEAVRFDYSAHAAYVSVSFDSTTDDIFLRVTDGAGQPVEVQFLNICRYYDNRQSVVTATADDWEELTNPAFVQAVHTLRTYRLPLTTAIITGRCIANTWQTIQAELDSGLVEAASHTRTHTDPPYADPIGETLGSKEDLLANLRMPPAFRNGCRGYVYSWVAPYGSTTPQTEVYVGQARYLIDRGTFKSSGNFALWDSTQRRYSRDGKTAEMGPLYGGLTNASTLNNLFNQTMVAGSVYHLLLHPLVLSDSNAWSSPYTSEHLSYISNRTNVWYVNFGTLYLYHLLQDDAPGTIQIVSGPPAILVQPAEATVRRGQTATFSIVATGGAPLNYQWRRNSLDIPGATHALYTTPQLTQADSGTIFQCRVSNETGSVVSNNVMLIVLPPIINIVANASFESGTAPWVFYSNGVGVAGQAPFGTNGVASARLSVSVEGTDAQFYQANLALQPNTAYMLSFDAYCNSGHDFEASLSKHVSPYTNYGLMAHRFDLGTGWQSYSVTFTTGGFAGAVTDARLWFSIAPYDAAGDVYYIDNVLLARVTDLIPPSSLPPVVTLQPTPQTVTIGQTATFIVSATGTAPLSYQWQKDNIDVTGATSYTYTTPPATGFDNGTLYHCRIMNAIGSVTSADAQLSVIIPRLPLVSVEPRDTMVVEGHAAYFSVVAVGDTPMTYQWQRNGADVAGATAMVYVIQAASRADSGTAYRCIVSNIRGEDTSQAALLIVNPLIPELHHASPAPGSINQTTSPVLCWYRAAGVPLYHLQLSSDSSFAAGIIVDDSTLADTSAQVSGLAFDTRYFWRVKPMVAGGQFTLAWSFTTTVGPAAPPILLFPADETAGLAVAATNFVWHATRWTSTYRLQIAVDSSFASGTAIDDSTLTDTTSIVTTLHSDQRYFWRVSAMGPGGGGSFSAVRSFETIKSLPLAAALASPANGATDVPTVGLMFLWNSVPSATHYHFQLCTDSTFTGTLSKDDSALVDTARTVNGLKMSTRYFWRVRARNVAGWGEYSPAWTLVTRIPLPGQITLRGPATGALAGADTAIFFWERPHPPATRYAFEIATDSAFTFFPNVDSTLTDTVKVFGPLETGSWYYWRVRGWSPGGWGPYSEIRSVHVVINSITGRPSIPETFVLEQNHPNPFNPSTVIRYGLPEAAMVSLAVYNILGQEVARLAEGYQAAGSYQVTWQGHGIGGGTVSSGVYLCRLIATPSSGKPFVSTSRMVLMK